MISAAFFDVDETLIQCKSMFAFLKFFLEKTGLKLQSKTYTDIMSDIDRKVQSGANRSEINTYYYQLYKSVSQNQVRHYAKEFFSENKSNLFKNVTLALLQKHVANNVKVVFVSGAMPDILLPIADYLGVNEFICSLPEVVNGYYTGSLVQQAIGANKAQLMENYASENGIDLKQSYAYGDHISDQYMLELVGHPYVVDPNRDLLCLAQRRRWRIVENSLAMK